MANAIPMQFYIKNGNVETENAEDKLKKRVELSKVLSNSLKEKYTSINFKRGQRIETGVFTADDGSKTYIIIANITFMGGKEGQHPKDLKRIQYNQLWKDFYDKYNSQGRVLWMGLYSYKDFQVYGIFEPETYLKMHEGKSMISKGGSKAQYSCHIYLNDLYMCVENEWFMKTDKNGNKVGTVRVDCLLKYLNNECKMTNPIINVIENINKTQIKWDEWIFASEAIPYMKGLNEKNGFNQWKQNLWNGWYTEAIYSSYLYDNHCKYIDYFGRPYNEEIKKEYKEFGLDLSFPTEPYHFIGDLKAICIGNGNTLLNDEKRVNRALEKYKKIWFIMYIHDKKRGNYNEYEMVKWRNHFIKDCGEWDASKKFNEKDAPNTPCSIYYTEMIVIELNKITKDLYFEIGKQYGLNSDGSERNKKYKINKSFLNSINDDRFVIYRYRP